MVGKTLYRAAGDWMDPRQGGKRGCSLGNKRMRPRTQDTLDAVTSKTQRLNMSEMLPSIDKDGVRVAYGFDFVGIGLPSCGILQELMVHARPTS